MYNMMEIEDLIFERLEDHPKGHKYRSMESFCSNEFEYITDPKHIKKLDKAFGISNDEAT